MIRKTSFLALCVLSTLNASEGKNLTAAYNGNMGVFETPNARIMEDWSMRLFLNEDKPFRYYGIAFTPLPFLEANFHVTQIDGVRGFDDVASYGDYKDKSLSFKILLKKEGRYNPSLVVGADDIWGTALYTSKYIAASKNLGYFDLTLGYAKGRLGGEKIVSTGNNSGSFDNEAINFLKNTDWGGGKPFGSVVFNATPKLKIMTEYSPIKYENDKINPFSNGNNYELPKSNFNYGLKYSFSDNSTLNLSYQRGNTVSFGYTYSFSFDRTGIIEHEPDPKWEASKLKKDEYKNLNKKELVNKLSNEVAAEKFTYVKTAISNNEIWSEINNTRYHHDLKAVGRAISTIDEVAPKKYDTIYMTLKDNEIKHKTIRVNRKEFDMYEKGKVSDDYMSNAILVSSNVDDLYEKFNNTDDFVESETVNKKNFSYSIKPKIRSYLNKKEKPLALKFTVQAKAKYDILDNLSINTAIEHPFYNEGKDLPVEPLENEKLSIRSNFMEHFKYNDTQLSYLNLIYKNKLPNNIHFKTEFGYLEYAYMGADIELFKTFYNDRFGLGLQYQNVYKREVDDMFALKKHLKYDTKFLNIYYLLSPKHDLHLGAKVGQFLAGDKGVRFDLSRNYKGFSMGLFASYTDSKDIFDNPKNQGYIDKGFYLKVPFEVFTSKNLKRRINFNINAWTRDTGQYVGTLESLYPMNNSENNSIIMKKNINKLKE